MPAPAPDGPPAWRSRTVAGDGLDLAVFEVGGPDLGGPDEGGVAAGAAPVVVLVHGYPDTHTVWDGVASRLAGRHHVVAYDVRGAGRSGVPATTEGYDLTHLVADLTAVVDAVSPDAAIHLVGHDWGSIQSWEAVTTSGSAGRIASFTSISGPSLDHVGQWMRRRRSLHPGLLGDLLRQAPRSLYIVFFRVPRLPERFWRTRGAAGFTSYLRRVEGVPETSSHPAPTLAEDGARGVGLYRRNMGRRIGRPGHRVTDVPVQVLVPRGDRFVTPALTADTHRHATRLRRHLVDGPHWVPVTDPDLVAGAIQEHIDAVIAGGATGG